MKIKRNKKSCKWFLCGLILVVVLTISYRVSKANYRISNSIELTTGKVVSSPYDLNIVAMYIDGVEQSKDTTMPGKGYVLTSDSYCYKKNKEEKDTTVILETNKYGEHIIGELSKSSKCVLYFERKEGIDTASKYILSKINEVTHRKRGTFNQVIEGETTGKIYAESDDDGVTYYYAGNPTDNWVLFGGYYWRIIRINGDGTIRMIYQGKESEGPQTTGEGTVIKTSKFSNLNGSNIYVGYWYKVDDIDTPSTAYTALNDWFKNESGLTNSEYFDKIDLNAGFCGDRTAYIDTNGEELDIMAETRPLYYGAYIRLLSNENIIKPTFSCIRNDDLYTYINANVELGNHKLENPVGLITVDEAAYAGMKYANISSGNYLDTDQHYWTISPYITNASGNSAVFRISSDGNFGGSNNGIVYTYGLRPVINLRSDVNLSGDGTSSNPYKIT